MDQQPPTDTNPTAASGQGELYERALSLIDCHVQIFWLVFGAFLLAETVLLGGIASLVKDGPPWLVFGGALLGLFLAVSWWTSFHYNHALYHLRVMQARQLEPAAGTFLTEGERLIKGETIYGVTMPASARWWPPRKGCASLILAFILSFVLLAVMYCPLWHAQAVHP